MCRREKKNALKLFAAETKSKRMQSKGSNYNHLNRLQSWHFRDEKAERMLEIKGEDILGTKKFYFLGFEALQEASTYTI